MIQVSLPPLFHEHVLEQWPKLTQWGAHVILHADRSTTIVFPAAAELGWYIDGLRIGMVTLREEPPSLAMATWTFHAEHIEEIEQ